MPIPLGILAVAGAGAAGGGGAFDLLETTVLSTTASSVTFSSLGSYSDYKHLQIRGVVAKTSGFGAIDAYINGDTGSNYAGHLLRGDGSSVSTFARSSSSTLQLADCGSTSDVFAPFVTDILDFNNSSKNTTIRTFTGVNDSNLYVQIWSGLWNNTAAVTSFQIYGRSGSSMQIGSRFSLYGVK